MISAANIPHDLRSGRGNFRWPALFFAAALLASACSRAGGPAPVEVSNTDASRALATAAADERVGLHADAEPTQERTADEELVADLERLRKRGEFAAYVDGALIAADEHADNVAVRLEQTEALLGSGRNAEAEYSALAAARLALGETNPALCSHALKLWTIARFRGQKPLVEPRVTQILAALPVDDPTVETIRFWSDALAERGVYRAAGRVASRVEIQAARAVPGTAPAELNAIRVKINGVDAPLAFVDTGTQQTLLTVAAAKAAGVVVGPSSTRLVGFARLNARPGVIERLELDGLALHDVPVLVGDSPPLVALQGQMAIGTELMHHVRFTIDYPARRVFAEPALARAAAESRRPAAEIPLWTFSQACLARGAVPGGTAARVLVDTGDHAGTFVSTRWARRNLPDFQRPVATVVFKFKQRNLKLAELELGTSVLQNWPIEDTLPGKLERLDSVDLLVGHDLLAPYEVTIDLAARTLSLYEPEALPPADARGSQ